MTVRELIEQLNTVPEDRQDQEVEVHEGEYQPGEQNASSFRRSLPERVVISASKPCVIIKVKHPGHPLPKGVSYG